MSAFRTFIPTEVKKQKGKKNKRKTNKRKTIKWRRPYRNQWKWINELAISDQVTLFEDMEEWMSKNVGIMSTIKTEFKWRNLIKNLKNFIERTGVPIHMTGLLTPRLLSFPNNFTSEQLQDILEWYENTLKTNKVPKSKTIPNVPPINNPAYVNALRKASKNMTKNHFVFEGVNYFFEEIVGGIPVQGLYQEGVHQRPMKVKRLHPNCRRQLIPPKMEIFRDENNNLIYTRKFENGLRAICTKKGKIISYIPNETP